MHYKIVQDNTVPGLADKVISNIKAGFEPTGGIATISVNESETQRAGVQFYQAMISQNVETE